MNNIHAHLYNDGERLVPFVSHDVMELQRHYSSYAFFKDVIQKDIQAGRCNKETITILELGFGVGYGTKMLSELPGVKILAIDNSEDCRQYALKNHNAPNIEYRVEDIAAFLSNEHSYDYIISRGVMEHVPDGINIMNKAKYNCRVMFDVPYNENVEANEHHLVTRITEDHFNEFTNCEFLYEDLAGMIFAQTQKPPAPNLIMCARNGQGMPLLNEEFSYPISPRLPPFSHTRYFINNFLAANTKDKARLIRNHVRQPLIRLLNAVR